MEQNPPIVQNPTQAPVQVQTPTPTVKPEDIATALINAVDSRTQRVERSISKSFAEQYGMSEQEVDSILSKAKAEKAAQIPAAAQAKIDQQMQAINNRLIAASVREEGAKLGLVDAEAALMMIKREGIKVDESGAVTGVKEALEALAKDKQYLFTAVPTGRKVDVGPKIDKPIHQDMDGVEAAFLRLNPGIKI